MGIQPKYIPVIVLSLLIHVIRVNFMINKRPQSYATINRAPNKGGSYIILYKYYC